MYFRDLEEIADYYVIEAQCDNDVLEHINTNMNVTTINGGYEINDDSWIKDLSTAKALLNKEQGKVSSINMEWLLDVIDMASYEERKELREGLEIAPRSLWFDYDKQCWID